VAPDLALEPVQIGIVIYGGETQGARCEAGRYPDVYTQVAFVRDFARQARPPLAPFSTATPRIVRRAADGGRPRCLRGEWAGGGLRFRYRWEDRRRLSPDRRGFLVLARGRSPVLRVRERPGERLACVVIAGNRGGHFARSSRAAPTGPDAGR
jgi:hypothetical protein